MKYTIFQPAHLQSLASSLPHWRRRLSHFPQQSQGVLFKMERKWVLGIIIFYINKCFNHCLCSVQSYVHIKHKLCVRWNVSVSAGSAHSDAHRELYIWTHDVDNTEKVFFIPVSTTKFGIIFFKLYFILPVHRLHLYLWHRLWLFKNHSCGKQTHRTWFKKAIEKKTCLYFIQVWLYSRKQTDWANRHE